jgi:thiamine biosynthesis lipoprotein
MRGLTNLIKNTVWILCFGFMVLLAGCDSIQSSRSYPFLYADAIMGTTFSIKVSKMPAELKEPELKQQIMALLTGLDAQMSTYKPDSELNALSQNPHTDWISVSPSLYTVIKEAYRIYELSSGAFDITVGPLVNLWGFGPDWATLKAPEDETIATIKNQMGSAHLHFDDNLFKIKKDKVELSLDLSAIAKGYAVDRVASLLESLGIQDYMVEIGGELRLKGLNLNQQKWRIAVERPAANERSIQKVLAITDTAIATSGDYRNFFEVDGVRFSHTIDPRTGKPIRHNLASVTVLHPASMTADALATAFMVKTEAGFKEIPSTLFQREIEKL